MRLYLAFGQNMLGIIKYITNIEVKKKKILSGQSMAEYIITLFLVALVVAGSYDIFSRALASFYNRIHAARTGTRGIGP